MTQKSYLHYFKTMENSPDITINPARRVERGEPAAVSNEVAELRRKIQEIINSGRLERNTPELRKIAA